MAETKSLYNFMSAMGSNPVRANNLFEMSVHLGDHLIGLNVNGKMLSDFFNDTITFYGTGFTLPTRSLQYATVGFKGYTMDAPTAMRMGHDHTVQINGDIKGNMRRGFLAWQSVSMNPDIKGYFEGSRSSVGGGQGSQIRIKLLDPSYDEPHRIIEQYNLFGVTVRNVGEQTFSNTGDQIATFPVQFNSTYWQLDPNFLGNSKDQVFIAQK
jgi:hypothetical protein